MAPAARRRGAGGGRRARALGGRRHAGGTREQACQPAHALGCCTDRCPCLPACRRRAGGGEGGGEEGVVALVPRARRLGRCRALGLHHCHRRGSRTLDDARPRRCAAERRSACAAGGHGPLGGSGSAEQPGGSHGGGRGGRRRGLRRLARPGLGRGRGLELLLLVVVVALGPREAHPRLWGGPWSHRRLPNARCRRRSPSYCARCCDRLRRAGSGGEAAAAGDGRGEDATPSGIAPLPRRERRAALCGKLALRWRRPEGVGRPPLVGGIAGPPPLPVVLAGSARRCRSGGGALEWSWRLRGGGGPLPGRNGATWR
mmetsp:Transcript_3857/g.14345  ORF Transcript_3857/g.14345 Transcript_3857/m.14345 type:complete len:315 (+) Transcript_3857:168-1112(+)